MSKKWVMKCDCCGKEFKEEYGPGSYSDHVENFSDDFCRMSPYMPVEDIAREITHNADYVRDPEDMKERLHCLLMSNLFTNSKKEEVKKLCAIEFSKISASKSKIRNFLDSLTDEEKKLLIFMLDGYTSSK